MRGPVLPQLRASVWSQLTGRLDAIERGLVLVFEGIDCSAGQFGLVEALARDAMGGAVLVLVAVDGDGLLTARVHAACEFLSRVGESLPAALPEANLVAGVRGRVLVVGTDAGAGALDLLRRLPLPGLEVCRLESFRVADSERFVVRWLAVDPVGSASPASLGPQRPSFAVPERRRGDWEALQQLCERIDPGVGLDGDRFSRRITWHGRLLGCVETADGELCGIDVHGARHPLVGGAETRRFVDRLLRRYSQLAGLTGADASAGAGETGPTAGVVGVPAAGRPVADSLRSTLSAMRLSPEEYSALGGPTAAAAAEVEHGNVADDVARIVTAKGPPWPDTPRPGPAERRTD